MTPLFSFMFVLQLFGVFLASGVAFFLPGVFFLSGSRLSPRVRLLLAPYVGMALWGVAGYIFGLIQARWLLYPYCLIFGILGGVYVYSVKPAWYPFLRLLQRNLLLLSLLFIGVISQIVVVFFMGTLVNGSMVMCCGHVPDNTLFLAITSEVVKHFPPQDPGLAGVTLQNYHILGHVVVGNLIWMFNVPLLVTTYPFFSIFLSLGLGISAIGFSVIATLPRRYMYWLLFFLYFGADAVFLLVMMLQKQFLFYFSPMESGTTFLFNYPRAFSIIGLFIGLALLQHWLRHRRRSVALLCIIILASLIGYKAYTGVFVWAGMAGLFIWAVWKKDISTVLLAVSTVMLSRFVFAPSGTGESGLFWSGMWRIHDFFAMHELGLSHWLLARQIFVEHANYIRVWWLDGWMFVIFILVTFGTKLIGMVQNKHSIQRLPGGVHAFLIWALVSNSFVGLFFLQKPGGSISVNFLITSVIMFSLYASLSMAYVWSRLPHRVYLTASVLLIILTVPRAVHSVVKHVQQLGNGKVPIEHMQFYESVKRLTDKDALIFSVGLPVDYSYLYQSFLTDRSQYLVSSMYSPQARETQALREVELRVLQTSTDSAELTNIYHTNDITHVIVYRDASFPSRNNHHLYTTIVDTPCCTLYGVSN